MSYFGNHVSRRKFEKKFTETIKIVYHIYVYVYTCNVGFSILVFLIHTKMCIPCTWCVHDVYIMFRQRVHNVCTTYTLNEC